MGTRETDERTGNGDGKVEENRDRRALERKGKRGVDTSEIGRQDWDRQAVQRQNGVGRAERSIGLMKGG